MSAEAQSLDLESVDPPPRFPLAGIISLALAVFISVSAEFLPSGLLPEISAVMGRSTSTAGLLVSVFAGTVVVSTVPLAALTRGLPRKTVLVLALSTLTIATAAAALAPTFELLLASRVLAGMAHGLFWSVVATYATRLVPLRQLGTATAITSSGGTAALVIGAPLATAVGVSFGWRIAFATVMVSFVALLVIVLLVLPRGEHPSAESRRPSATLHSRGSIRPMLLVSVVILMLMVGQYTFYTYFATWMVGVADLSRAFTPGLLFVFGGFGVAGLAFAGYAADRYLNRALLISGTLVVGALLVLIFSHTSSPMLVASTALWGAAFGSVPPLLQTSILKSAPLERRDLAGAMQTTAFNLGIGVGAFLGGRVIIWAGLAALPWVDIGVTIAGLLCAATIAVSLRLRSE